MAVHRSWTDYRPIAGVCCTVARQTRRLRRIPAGTSSPTCGLSSRAFAPMMSHMSSETDFQPALRVVLMPKDANPYGIIYGGIMLAYIDQAAFIEARKHGMHRWVTASVDRVDFHAPVHIGDIVSLLTRTHATGTSSATVNIRVLAERYLTGDVIQVTEATLTMVSVNAAGRPIPLNSPATIGPTGQEFQG